MEFILHNHKIVSHDDFNPREQWLEFALSIRFSMWFANGEIPFFDNHIFQINQHFEHLRREYRAGPSEQNEVKRLINRLINKNKAYMGGWIVLSVFPAETNWQYIARVVRHPQRELPFEKQGRLAQVSDFRKISYNQTGPYTVFTDNVRNAEILKMAGTRFGEAIFCNENGFIADSVFGNLFCIEKDTLVTPSLATGCTNDNLRKLTLSAALKSGLAIFERDDIAPSALQKMDEIFITSEESGFKWILGIGMKRFVRKKTEAIYEIADKLLWSRYDRKENI
jgi:branched-subunit amino acid aminotransferase/4-amino-4-deoxychorismate lyase